VQQSSSDAGGREYLAAACLPAVTAALQKLLVEMERRKNGAEASADDGYGAEFDALSFLAQQLMRGNGRK
jgi:hypothetical protein